MRGVSGSPDDIGGAPEGGPLGPGMGRAVPVTLQGLRGGMGL